MKKFLLLFIIFYCLPMYVYADNISLQQGSLSVSPVLIETTLKSNESEHKQITITNNSDEVQFLKYSVQDFSPDDGGGVYFFPMDDAGTGPYSLKNWISFEKQPEFEVLPHSSTTIDFTIHVPVSVNAGSHFAGVLFSFDNKTDRSNVQVSRKLAVLVIVRSGRGNSSGEMSVELPKFAKHLTVPVSVSFTNTGNVHLSPKGEVHFYNLFGHLSESVVVNRDAGLVLPGQKRNFVASTTKWLFGRYRVETILYYGGDPKLEAVQTQIIWVFPLRQVWSWFCVTISFLVLCYFGLTRYNEFVRRKYQS